MTAKHRAGDISQENGGPMAALAGMEIQSSNVAVQSNGAVQSMEGQAMQQQRRPSPKAKQEPSILETMLAMQFQATTNAQQEREAERKRAREEARRERRREERREQMFLNILAMGVAAFRGSSGDDLPSRLFQRGQDGQDDSSTSSSSDDSPVKKTPRREK
jgi:hypothetical protein